MVVAGAKVSLRPSRLMRASLSDGLVEVVSAPGFELVHDATIAGGSTDHVYISGSDGLVAVQKP